MDLYLAKTHGFCAGVAYAISIVEKAINSYGLPIYVYHEIVHNSFVVNDFKSRGVIFVETLRDVPDGSYLILSAHGVPPEITSLAKTHGLTVIDATCPLVQKVHNQAIRYSENGYPTVLIGHKGHQEMIGTAGYVKPELLYFVETESDVNNLPVNSEATIAYLTQTTLSLDETALIIQKLKSRYRNIVEPHKNDICYATQNRQNAIKDLATFCDIVIICGSPNSSNSNRLRETAQGLGVPSYIVDSAADLDFTLLEGKKKVGISSGASVPRWIVDDLLKALSTRFPGARLNLFPNPEKNIVFPIPKILLKKKS